jgi:glutamate-ammonia-ligase adenylyltransferase
MAVIGMGRLGGRELGYGSDVDLLIVYDQTDGVTEPAATEAAASAAAAELIRLVGGDTPATGVYRVDLALRPEGRQGPPARSIDAYAAYYERWAQPWDRQALLRGRVVAGDPEVAGRFESLAVDFLWNRPFGEAEIRQIRRTKARIERERVPPGEDPKFHLKLGPGSLSDVEWTIQLLQLQHGIRAAGTMDALEGLRRGGFIDPTDASTLADAYRFCERARNRLHLIRDLPGGDALPATGPLLSVVARSLGFSASGLRNEYGRLTRRAREVVERLFYGRS